MLNTPSERTRVAWKPAFCWFHDVAVGVQDFLVTLPNVDAKPYFGPPTGGEIGRNKISKKFLCNIREKNVMSARRQRDAWSMVE